MHLPGPGELQDSSTWKLENCNVTCLPGHLHLRSQGQLSWASLSSRAVSGHGAQQAEGKGRLYSASISLWKPQQVQRGTKCGTNLGPLLWSGDCLDSPDISMRDQLAPGHPRDEGTGRYSGLEHLENGLGFFCLLLWGLLQAQGLWQGSQLRPC